MRRRLIVTVTVTVTVLALMAIAIVVAILNGSRLAMLYEDVVLDNRTTRVPCAQRPSVAQARRVLVEHQDLVRRILAVEGAVSVEVDELACPGWGTLVIFYNARRDRRQIERLIGADTFFGIPCSLRDV
jgi:hypothetical protein